MIRLAGFEPEKEIPIQIVGTRPGEKIYEEVLAADETLDVTENELIFVTRNVLEIGEKALLESFMKLLSLAEQQKRPEIVSELKRVLINYQDPAIPVIPDQELEQTVALA